MLPSALAHDVTEGLKNFIITGFETPTPHFQGIFSRFVEEPGNLYKGPYLSLNLPFITGTIGRDYFPGIEMPFPPHSHQQVAFDRLKSDSSPKSTIIATGTGSGKTECFLYPILDHCQSNPGKGIKAIIIYPMNALATDQAKRFAENIHHNAGLRGKIRVGLFVGEGEHTPNKGMTQTTAITDKDSMRKDPPDILLTNYKMLDYLLIRPRDRSLWKNNEPEILRYLVVDELHTFDGAQGTDLACLLRRLNARLETPKDQLVCIGTSATLGSKDEKTSLIEYAKQIFNSNFDSDCVVGERRQSMSDFLDNPIIRYQFIPPADVADVINPDNYNSYLKYIVAQFNLLFPNEEEAQPEVAEWCQKLGLQLKEHLLFHNLLRLLENQPRSLTELSKEIEETIPNIQIAITGIDVLNSLCALISCARDPDDPDQPWVQLKLQLWLRELRRMVSRVVPEKEYIKLSFADDVNKNYGEIYLPLVQCNECHSVAWLTTKPPQSTQVVTDLRSIYSSFFGNNPDTHILFPLEGVDQVPAADGYQAYLCATCGNLQSSDETCQSCHETELVHVFRPDNNRQRKLGGVNVLVSERNCPICSSRDSLIVFGSRVASLLSVSIQHSYSSIYNDDRKLIAFSDSVQDAAHRAGFLMARTWQNNIRQAITQAMMAIPDKAMPLEEFYRYLPLFWSDKSRNAGAFEEKRYITEFIAPNMLWYQDYDAFKKAGKLPEDSNLIDDINKRLEWEIIAECGYRSRIGRSLDRSGTIAVGFEWTRIEDAILKLLPIIREEIGSLRDLSEIELGHFLLGILLHLKSNGAIYHRFLDAYIGNDGNSFFLNRQSYLPPFATYSSSPIFLVSGNKRKKFETITKNKGKTWYELWCLKTLGRERPLESDIISIIYKSSIDALVDSNVLMSLPVKEKTVYAINPDSLFVSSDVNCFESRSRTSRLNIPSQMSQYIDGMPSIEAFDISEYEEKDQDHWLRNYYQHGVINRVIAEEHTGILDGKLREEIENNFKDRKQPWHPNLLSATPTLEMGIDIGSLSSVMLCSIPPAQTNYIQRIGRAGRRDGNAFNLAVAAGRPHDLYFYSEPMQMMAGRIEPPGVYLNASAVIARQLTAFCFDNWVSDGIDASAIPHKMRAVLDNVQAANLQGFPYNLLKYIKDNADSLLSRFIILFQEELTNRTKDHLREFLLGDNTSTGGIEDYLIKRLFNVVKERQSLKSRIDSLKRRIDRLEDGPQDEAIKEEIKQALLERGGLQAVLRSINSKETFNFFTDEGLIPNYAFPEQGVILRSLIYRKRKEQQEDQGKYENFVFEYERPGVAAISELAPDNRFYAGGRKVKISQIDLNLSEIEDWRFCPSCSRAENLAQGDHHSSCPNCGDLMWRDSSQRQKMIKLRQVLANTSDKDSRIGDDSDDRGPTFYTRQMLADFSKEDVEVAYKIADDSLPFGFEFIRKSAFREMNFGEREEGQSTITIAGIEAWRPGFKLCKYCGMVQEKRGNKQIHAFTCKSPDKEDKNNIMDCLYLYREFTSEAIRILMPGTNITESDQMINSFIAAIQLGLKAKFGGKVDHLRMMVYEEPILNSSIRKQFLMLYDSIPGGTGYLHELMIPPENLLEAFTLSRDIMVACKCHEDPEKDGCYQCLYAYRNSYGMESTSRDTAISLLNEILEAEDKFEKIDSISDISINPILESELEKRFIEAISKYDDQNVVVEIKPQIINGKPGYFLVVNNYSYTIEPQIDITKNDGVYYQSRPDFLIKSTLQRNVFKPLAIFMDGFKYHKDIVTDDTLKRLSIVQSDNYFQWTLTWNDLNTFVKGKTNDALNYFINYANQGMTEVKTAISERLELDTLSSIHLKNSFEQLFSYLANPVVTKWRGAAFVQSLSWFDQSTMQDKETISNFTKMFQKDASSAMEELFDNLPTEKAVGGFNWEESDIGVKMYCSIPLAAISELNFSTLTVLGVFNVPSQTPETEFRPQWAGFWHAYNLLQFLPNVQHSTQEGINNGSYEAIAFKYANSIHNPEKSDKNKDLPKELQEIIGFVNENYQEGLIALVQETGQVPAAGFELQDNDGEIIAEAELAWVEERMVLLTKQQLVYSSVFIKLGWTVIKPSEQNDWIGILKASFMEVENA